MNRPEDRGAPVAARTPIAVAVTLPDGARLQALSTGVGEPVLFISGLSGAAAFWQETTAQIFLGYHSIVFDQRGIGASTRGTASVTIEQLALDSLAVLDALGLAEAHVVGHSTGGCIAMALALSHPKRVRSMVLSGTWAGPNAYMHALFERRLALLQTDPALYESLGPFLLYPPIWLTANPALLTSNGRSTWTPEKVRIVQERIQALMAFDQRSALQELRHPCLVVGARDDLVVPLPLQQELLRWIPGAQHHFFDDGGHFYPKTRSAAFAQIIAHRWAETHPQ